MIKNVGIKLFIRVRRRKIYVSCYFVKVCDYVPFIFIDKITKLIPFSSPEGLNTSYYIIPTTHLLVVSLK